MFIYFYICINISIILVIDTTNLYFILFLVLFNLYIHDIMLS